MIYTKFESKTIKRSNGCWEWKASKHGQYGWFTCAGRTLHAYQWSYILYKGDIPKGQVVRHKCNNKLCV
ncbi:hypothetical protein LCGC14_2691880, partial [marine sediment metagenome]